METLKERLRNDQDQGMVAYQEGVERRLQRHVDARDRQPASGGSRRRRAHKDELAITAHASPAVLAGRRDRDRLAHIHREELFRRLEVRPMHNFS